MGFSQPGRCSLSYNYNIRDVPIITIYNSTISHTNGIITNPIIYQEDGYSCIDDEHISSCQALRNSTVAQLPSELFTRHFTQLDSIMFPSDIFICVFCLFFMMSISPVFEINPAIAHTLFIYCTSYIIQIIATLLSLTIIYSSRHPEGIKTESCDASSFIKPEEANTLCHALSVCGLTLASVYTSPLPPYYVWLFMSMYSWVTYTLGVFMLCTGVSHIVLLILYGIYSIYRVIYERRYDALRLAILSKQGDELSLALEAAPASFIDYYISNWTRPHATTSRQASTTGIRAPATYSPLAMIDTESGPDTDLTTLPLPPVTDIEHDSSVCSLCQNAIFTDNSTSNGEGGDSSDRKVIQLQCSHSFHQVCILQWIIAADSTHTACPICRQKLK